MLTQDECEQIKHLIDAGKGVIEITGIVSRQRAEKSECALLSEVIVHVNEHLHTSDAEGGVY